MSVCALLAASIGSGDMRALYVVRFQGVDEVRQTRAATSISSAEASCAGWWLTRPLESTNSIAMGTRPHGDMAS